VVWANVQWPPTIDEPLQAAGWTIYGQVYVPGITDSPSGSPDLVSAQLGWGASSDRASWQWLDATFNAGHTGDNNYEYVAQFTPATPGTYHYGYRYSTDGAVTWTNAGVGGPNTEGGVAHIAAPADTTPPAAPTGLAVASSGPTEIDLTWNPSPEGDLFGYEIDRSTTGSYTKVGTSTGASFADTTVANGTTYSYVVKAIDRSGNTSGASAAVTATAALRRVNVVFTVTVPASTPATVHIAGSFHSLDASYPDWDPASLPMTKLDATHWRITLSGLESTQLQYKYVLGDWNFVEKGAACDELANRTVTVAYGTTGTQAVGDTVVNWRDVSPCGD
jgi:hypothetical protein